MEFSSLKNNIILECEKTEDKLKHTWYPSIINLFADKNAFTGIKPDKQESFYNCVTTLISNQVRYCGWHMKTVKYLIIKSVFRNIFQFY